MAFKWKIDHSTVYFIGLSLMVIALPLSKFLMSIAQFILAINWLIEGEYKRKIKTFFHNKAALVLVSLYLLHVIGLIYTTDFNYALKDLRIKLPLFVFPIILSTTPPLEWKRFKLLMLIFAASVLVGTFISTYILATKEILDIREISIFISHIRFSLNIDIAIFALIFFIIKEKEDNIIFRSILILVTTWLVVFLFLFESMTGLTILFIVTFILLVFYLLKRSNIYYNVGFAVIVIIAGIMFSVLIKNIIHEVYNIKPVDFSKLEKYTPYGNKYRHDTTKNFIENGNYVWLYVSVDEMREAWNEQSEIHFDSLDMKSQHLSNTLIRFLTSKGLRKDRDGVKQLTNEEIGMVERGIANVKYHRKSSLRSRIHKIIWEYRNFHETGDPSGYSVVQRLEFWKASLGIIKRNPIIGVGTGDMNIAFDEQYERMKSPLEEKYQWRSHNQFLSIFVGFGVIGLVWFFFSMLYPPLKLHKFNDYFYMVFFIIIILSMMNEDTIESQAGVTFFAFFNALFLFGRKN